MAHADDAVARYLDDLNPQQRAMFDRVDRLVTARFPDATLGLAYGMPTYRVDRRRLHVGAWKHGLSLYSWDKGRAAEVLARHPQLRTSTGTIRLRPSDEEMLTDDDLRQLVAAALDPG
jgi:uncharacterized protein YdhG (YjbR/CyaY superfamily)